MLIKSSFFINPSVTLRAPPSRVASAYVNTFFLFGKRQFMTAMLLSTKIPS